MHTDFELLSWDDLIENETARSTLMRLGRSVAVYANLITSGTLLRYYVANPRYFAFAIAPLFQLFVLLLLSVFAGFAVDVMAPQPWS